MGTSSSPLLKSILHRRSQGQGGKFVRGGLGGGRIEEGLGEECKRRGWGRRIEEGLSVRGGVGGRRVRGGVGERRIEEGLSVRGGVGGRRVRGGVGERSDSSFIHFLFIRFGWKW